MRISWRFLTVLSIGTLVFASIVASGALVLGRVSQAHAASALPSGYFAPYAEVGVGDSLASVTQNTGQKYYTLAFIIANGCQGVWGGGGSNVSSDIQAIRAQGGDVIVSFGGAAGQELAQACSDASSLQAQYQAIINRYNVTHLDFDVEGGEQGDQTTYDRRNTALAALQQANPGLTISFTLPSATTGLESDSIGLLNNAVSHGVTFNIVNLMVMDYGGPDSQMGQEAINAANGLHGQLQQIFLNKSSSQLWSMVGLTPMIGKNDSSGEVFSLSNASQVLSFAQSNKIGELSFWAVSRDNGGCPGETGNGSSDTCSGISQSNYAFLDTFEPFTSGSSGGGATYYKIVNQNSGLALDVTNQSTSNGAVVQQWDYVGGANQQWQLISVGGGYDEIVNRNSGLALDVTNQSTSNGAVIQQWAYTGNGGANQKWQVVDVGSGYDKIVNQNSSKVLDVTNHSTSNGAVIQQWDYVGGSNQQWSLQQV